MNEGALRTKAQAPSEARGEAGPAPSARPQLKGVTLLLPVWGFRFVSQFLEFGLPTLLAPGNIPALAADLPCRFVLLSSEADEPVVRAHPAWQRLEQICAAEVRAIDDLITDGNHSATITLAFARAVRESGEAMLDTCFIFLVSDYLVADGSLRSVLARVRAGASGVLAGNYQIVAEDAVPLLRRRVDPESPSIVLPPRELVRWSLAHLHPATVANIVNFGLTHNAHVNRLFWRVDEQTLIGRFYLMHMIAIRPEVTDFVVGGSCDYSFIPEMCPSGNVAALTDSDEYLVLEMQPRDHEVKHLLPGPLAEPALAASLAEWATADHRRNVERTLVYHAGELPGTLPEVVAEADAFVARVRALLPPQPHPHRHHHYWIGSLAVNRARSRRPLSKKDWEFLLGEQIPSGGLAGLVWRLRTRFLRSPPDVTKLHPRWPDYGLALKSLRQIASNGRLLLVAPQPNVYAHWLTQAGHDSETLECDRLLELARDVYVSLVGTFDACLLVLSEAKLRQSDELIERAGPLLKPGGPIMVMITNDRPLDQAMEFSRAFVRYSALLLNPSTWLAEVHYVPTSRMRWALYRAMNHLAARGGTSGWRSPVLVPLLALIAAPLAAATYLCNTSIRARPLPPQGLWSSVFLILRPMSTTAQLRLPQFKSGRNSGRRAIMSPDSRQGSSARTRSGFGGRDIWLDDPSALALSLARYRFVANLLRPRHDVAEYGCGNGFGTRIVLQEVRKITVYDPDPVCIADVGDRFSPEWSFEAHVHHILDGPLPKRHDSIFSLDTMKFVSHDDEDSYVRNLRDSLSRDYDVLIVGNPGFGVGARALDASQARSLVSAATRMSADLGVSDMTTANVRGAAIVPRTGEEMKALLDRYFHDVFLFSMIDEIVHPGVLPLAHYVVALCCTIKR